VKALLAYGFPQEAAQLDAASVELRCPLPQGKWLPSTNRYHALTGAGMGERGSLAGFAPVGLS